MVLAAAGADGAEGVDDAGFGINDAIRAGEARRAAHPAPAQPLAARPGYAALPVYTGTLGSQPVRLHIGPKPDEQHDLWGAITCPVLLLYGGDSWASNPERDGRAKYFRNARVVEYEKAGHWLHHDQFERFVAELKAFLP